MPPITPPIIAPTGVRLEVGKGSVFALGEYLL